MGLDQEMVTGNGSDKDYQFPDYEDSFVHLRLENPEFDPRSGARLSTPFIQKYSVNDFKQAMNVDGFAQYKVEVLHDPTKGPALKPEERDYIAGNITDEALNKQKGLLTDASTVGGFTPTRPEYHDPNTPLAPVEGVTTPTTGGTSADANVDNGQSTAAWDKGFRKADYQEKYKELYGEEVEDTVTIPELKEAIEHKLANGE